MAVLFEQAGPMVGTIGLDLSIREAHGVEVETTDNPIESGAEITDHFVDLPDTLVMSVIQTDAAIIGGFPGRAKLALRQLEAMAKRHEIVDVVTSTKRYRNMAILSMQTAVQEVQENAKRFQLTLREIQFAEVDDLAALSDLVVDQGMAEMDLGLQGVA